MRFYTRRHVQLAAVAVAAVAAFGAAPAHATGAGTAVGGANYDVLSGTLSDGAFSAAGNDDLGLFAANDCRFTATADTIDITDCDANGSQITGALTYTLTATVIDAHGCISINGTIVCVRVHCVAAVGAYVSVRSHPLEVRVYVGIVFKCVIRVRL